MSRFVHFCLTLCLLSLLIFASACKTFYSSEGASGKLTVLDSTMVSDSAALALIEPYKAAIDVEMNEIISFSEVAITKNQPEGLLNNFVSDIVLYMVNTYYNDSGSPFDVSIFNNGGLRAALPKGLVKVEDVYKLMPFENEVVILTLSSHDFLKMVQYVINSGGVPFAGMTIVTSQMKVKELKVGGMPYVEDRNYTVVTSDYLANGGDRMDFFQNPVNKVSVSVLIRDLIIAYLKEQNKIGVSLNPQLDGRIVYE
jgi:2',3'-cyclic-nucleotide 2'-phosphodiesterase (5'-nucleotidase family)